MVLWVEGSLLQHDERLSVIKRKGNDAIIIFRAVRQGVFRIGHNNDRCITMGNLDALSEL